MQHTNGSDENIDQQDPDIRELVFVPTLFELKLIARHWLKIRIEIDLMYFLYQQTGSVESRLDTMAQQRMEEISEVLGEDHYANFAAEMERELMKTISQPVCLRHTSQDFEQSRDAEFPA